MKPVGPIPAGYDSIDGELAIGGQRASAWVAEAGRTPLFVYSRSRDAWGSITRSRPIRISP